MKKQFALDKLFNFFIIFGLGLAWGSIEFFRENNIGYGVGFGIVALLFIVFTMVFTPYCYAFDSEGVSLCYVFLPVERYLWKDVHAIEVDCEHTHCTKGAMFDILFGWVFHIKGQNVGKNRFYMQGNIRKSFRTKRLLEKYWDGTITGYFFEDVKGCIGRRKAKKQSETREYLTDEVALSEREVRAEVRALIAPFIDKARQYDLEVKTKYYCITKDLKETRSRPKEAYTYTLVGEIAHFNEKDENRIVEVSVDLVYARLGKTRYRGVKNAHLKEELEYTFTDVLDEIIKNGIEAYCECE